MKPVCLLFILLICGEITSSYSFGLESQGILQSGNNNKLVILGTLIIWALPPAFSSENPKTRQVRKNNSNRQANINKNARRKKATKVKVSIEADKDQSEKDIDLIFEKEEKGGLDPMTCFPKALCGVSSEAAQISNRKKNVLITDYILLMKAIARHPDVVHEILSEGKEVVKQSEKPQKDISPSKGQKAKEKEPENSTSDEVEENKTTDSVQDDEDDNNDSDEEEDDEDENDDDDEPEDEERTPLVIKPKKRRKYNNIPKNAEEFDKYALMEKAHIDQMYTEALQKESMSENMWDLGDSHSTQQRPSWWRSKPPPSFHSSGGQQGPSHRSEPEQPPSHSSSYGYGSASSEDQQMTRPYHRSEYYHSPPEAPPKPPNFAYLDGEIDSNNNGGGFATLMSKLFNFGVPSSASGGGMFAGDSFYHGMARAPRLSPYTGETPLTLGILKTKEILETAMDIGKEFDKPSKCNEIFNACKFEYTELLYMIDDLRQSLRKRVRNDDVIKKDKKPGNSKPSLKFKGTKTKAKTNLKSKSSNDKNGNQKRRQTVRNKKNKKQARLPSESTNSDESQDRFVIPMNGPYNKRPQSYDQQGQEGMPMWSFSNMFSWLGL